jgi:hypothetical protein
MKQSVLCVAALISMLLSGCASDQANRYYGNEKFPPRPVEDVEILREPPSSEYEVIADFQSRGESPKDMQRKAAEIGADAVIVATVGGYRARSDEWAGVDSQSSTYSRIVGTAIRFKEKAK